MKGSYLKNTDFIYGIVVYTGNETKIMKNAKMPKNKVSKLMNTMNRILYFVMVIQFIFCFCFAILSIMWQKNNQNNYKDFNFLEFKESNMTLTYLSRFATFLIAYSQLIPISMYIGVEMIKLLHVPLIKYDDNLFDSETNRATVSRTSELIDELGQVDYIFSDKTGTLTKNSMILMKISAQDSVFNVDELVFKSLI